MKVFESAVIIIVMCAVIFSQSLPVVNSTKIKEIKTDTLSAKDTSSNVTINKDTVASTDGSGFVNPFSTEEEGGETVLQNEAGREEITDTTGNTLLTEDRTSREEDSFDEAEGGIDILVDLAVGMSLPRFDVKPDYIATEGKPSIIFSSGVVLPFAKYFYADIAVKYLQLSCNKSEYYSTDAGLPKVYSETKTKESLSFISAPLKVGMQFELGLFTPFFYADIEPAYLVAGGQFVKKKKNTVYPDGSQLLEEVEKNINTTRQRERHQIFVGGGIGCQMYYGYGYIYVDAGFQYATKENGGSEDLKKSEPLQLSDRVIYFPIIIGLRFFL